MKRFYDKNKLYFALACIAVYVVLFSLADKLSASIGIIKIITAPAGIAFALVLILFLIGNKLTEKHGLCKLKGSCSGFLFFVPIIPILGLYLWNGVAWEGSVFEAVLSVAAMLCVGFIEEMLFRGFLFTAVREDNLKVAVLVSSLTFGLGHIVNLLNGRELIPTLLQVCYATALGFLLTMMFYKGKSLLPGVIAHCIFNVLSIFNVSGTRTQSIVSSAALCIIAAAYALWIWKKADSMEEQTNGQQ